MATQITSLSIRQLDLEVRLYERLGEFFASVFKKPTKAKEYFSRAKSVAVEMGVPEATARIELKIILADLVSDRDPELENFKLLRRVAANSNYTCDEQLAAWHLHLGDLGPSSRGLRFARKLGTANEQYFSNLLESVRMTRK